MSGMKSVKQFLKDDKVSNSLFSSAVVATAATLGSVATNPESKWYKNLKKPSFQPPPIAFPLVWTPLYIGVASGVARALNELNDQGKSGRDLRWCLARNMVFNAGWSVLFFRSKNLPVATAGAALLALSSTTLAVRTAKVDKVAGIPVALYAGWTVFALGLTAEVYRLNR